VGLLSHAKFGPDRRCGLLNFYCYCELSATYVSINKLAITRRIVTMMVSSCGSYSTIGNTQYALAVCPVLRQRRWTGTWRWLATWSDQCRRCTSHGLGTDRQTDGRTDGSQHCLTPSTADRCRRCRRLPHWSAHGQTPRPQQCQRDHFARHDQDTDHYHKTRDLETTRIKDRP